MTEREQSGIYCTIVAQNYLPQALALYESVRIHEPDRELVILVVDGDRRDLEQGRPNLTVATSEVLGISTTAYDHLAAIYDVVELSTAVKPLLLRRLLADHEQAVYLDPDMHLTAPLVELEPLLREHGVVLTPHFLQPIPPDSSYISEVHSLTVGVHNLGFCATSRLGIDFLDWWWSHLERECLIYPLLGLFVDQKWTDIGGNLFHAHSLRHAGYNVGPWNLLERHIEETAAGLSVEPSGDALRLVHFSGFNPRDPDAVSERLTADIRGKATQSVAYRDLSRHYAAVQLEAIDALGPLPSYGYTRDSTGKTFTKRLRRTYRAELIAREARGKAMPSAFSERDRESYAAWRRRAWRSELRLTAGDAALAAKYAFPDQFGAFKKRFPSTFKNSREKLLSAGRVRR